MIVFLPVSRGPLKVSKQLGEMGRWDQIASGSLRALFTRMISVFGVFWENRSLTAMFGSVMENTRFVLPFLNALVENVLWFIFKLSLKSFILFIFFHRLVGWWFGELCGVCFCFPLSCWPWSFLYSLLRLSSSLRQHFIISRNRRMLQGVNLRDFPGFWMFISLP